LITTLAYTRIQRLIIQVTGSVAPTDREWDKYLDWLNTGGLDDVVRLVWTEGGEPSRAQRGHLRKLINDRHHPVAILCNQRLLIAEGPLLALIKFPVRLSRWTVCAMLSTSSKYRGSDTHISNPCWRLREARSEIASANEDHGV
jgi:hypothetical protein